jgi:hypothetical protein
MHRLPNGESCSHDDRGVERQGVPARGLHNAPGEFARPRSHTPLRKWSIVWIATANLLRSRMTSPPEETHAAQSTAFRAGERRPRVLDTSGKTRFGQPPRAAVCRVGTVRSAESGRRETPDGHSAPHTDESAESLVRLSQAFHKRGLPRALLTDFVPRHKIDVLCPAPICGGSAHLRVAGAAVVGAGPEAGHIIL